MTPTRAEENLEFWRGLVGLDAAFPELLPLTYETVMSSVVTDETQMEVVRSSLASQQLNQIVVESGWGATTLFKYLVREARDRTMERLTLPVAIDLETMFLDTDLTPAALIAEIQRQILGLMIDNPWESEVNRDYYFECIAYRSAVPLARHRADANQFLFFGKPPTSHQLKKRFPWLKSKLGDQVSYLLANLRIQTALYVHLPPDTGDQRMRDLVSAIKWIVREAPDMEYAAWRETYISSGAIAPELRRDFERAFEPINYDKYSPVQVYLMLISRYQPALAGLTGQRQMNLDSVFAPEFVDQAWHEATSLNDLSERVRQAILKRLDCPSDEVPFRLEPASVPVAGSAVEKPQIVRGSFAERRAARGRAST